MQDDDIQSNVLEIVGSNVQSTYITCPADPAATLGIKLPFFVIIVKNSKKYFTFEIQVLDDKNVKRGFRASNFQVCSIVDGFNTIGYCQKLDSLICIFNFAREGVVQRIERKFLRANRQSLIVHFLCPHTSSGDCNEAVYALTYYKGKLYNGHSNGSIKGMFQKLGFLNSSDDQPYVCDDQ
ncbi:hypothetical protein C5167_000971 [Papaver somniferum]|uniref:CFA20 domain-containing protein n=1 Tax=Papaver somniferum TaxID=3469 RepID=A0A4Y7KWW6_PAPSO|nr:hypothetical protein C5167_000971 [Papaver somniferum]